MTSNEYYRSLNQALIGKAYRYQRLKDDAAEVFQAGAIDFDVYNRLVEYCVTKGNHCLDMAKACLHKATPPGSHAQLPFLPPYPAPMTAEEESLVKEAEYLQSMDGLEMPLSLVSARHAAKLTQKGLADASGLHIRQIQKIEGGEVPLGNITAENFMALANALGMDPQKLCTWAANGKEVG